MATVLHRLVPIAIGVALSAGAVLADLLKGSSSDGFGLKQAILLTLGLLLATKGVLAAVPSRPTSPGSLAAPVSHLWLNVLGALVLTDLSVYAVLSHGIASQGPRGLGLTHDTTFFESLSRALTVLLRGDRQEYLGGISAFSESHHFFLIYSVMIVVMSAVFILLLGTLARSRRALGERTPRLLFCWATSFAAISAFASPVLVPDFWYPLAWGRMVVAGSNPYYVHLTPEFTWGLPLNPSHELMMYGPVLAVLSGIIMWVTGGQVLYGALLFKMLLAGAWIGSVRLIWLLLKTRPLWHRSVGIVIFGWLPLSVTQSVMEGHNDTFLVFFLLLWMYALEKGQTVLGSIALAVSVLLKYVTMPLFFLDFLHLVAKRKLAPRAYLPQLLVVTGFAAAIVGLFYRSLEFFAPIFTRTAWHFYSPREAVLALEQVLGVPTEEFGPVIARSVFWIVAAVSIAYYFRRPGSESFRRAILATISGVLFGYITGLWPWYLIWPVAIAALVPRYILARWVTGLAIVAPFPIAIWVWYADLTPFYVFDASTLVLYTAPLVWLMLMPAEWFPAGGFQGDEAIELSRHTSIGSQLMTSRAEPHEGSRPVGQM